MKEKILEILEWNTEVQSVDGKYIVIGKRQSAEDITAMVFEFIEWNNKKITWLTFSEIFYYSDEGWSFNTMNEVFNYWLTNIYKK